MTVSDVAIAIVGAFAVPFVMWIAIRLSNTYTKQETEKMIDLKVEPYFKALNDTIQNNTRSMEKLCEFVDRLDRSFDELHTDVTIIKTKLNERETN